MQNWIPVISPTKRINSTACLYIIMLRCFCHGQTKVNNILQSVAAKTMGPVAWVMPILIAVTACSSFNSGTMVGSRFLHLAYTHTHMHLSTLAAHAICSSDCTSWELLLKHLS